MFQCANTTHDFILRKYIYGSLITSHVACSPMIGAR